MKYCVYDKAADGYLTKMVFDRGLSNDTQFECGLNEYITNAKLLDTKKAAVDTIARIESFKFMEKGRFVVHQFDDTLADQYIISEAGNPTKVVDNITVDLDGTINVKYGTMTFHWSASSLDYVVNRLNRLQDASAPQVYTAWRDTFDIYKVITVIDERECTHYQFIKVTEKGLEEYKKDEEDKLRVAGNNIVNVTACLNKRIEDLENANYDLGEQVTARGAVANRLQEENDNLKAEVESIKKEARHWKTMYKSNAESRELLNDAIDIKDRKLESIKKEAHNWKAMYKFNAETLDILKDLIDTIYTDLESTTAYDDLKGTLKALSHNSDLDHIFMPTKTSYILDNGNCLTAKDEISSILARVLTIMESRELNRNVAFSSAEEVDRAKRLANNIIDICEETDDKFEITLNKFSQLYEAVNDPRDDNDTIMHAFKDVLEIFSVLEDKVRNIIDESVAWKHKAAKAEKALDNQKKLNEANVSTIVRYRNDMRDMDKKVSNAADWLEEANDKNEKLTNMLKEITDYIADIMVATRTMNTDKIISNLTDVSSKIGIKTVDDGPIYGVAIILNTLIRIAKERNEALDYNIDLKKERDKALEQKEFYKRLANSVYGMTIPCRCNGKQKFYDVTTGKKILVDKKKYDDLIECVNNINTTYEILKCADFAMNKPIWFDGVITRIKKLTE